MIPPLPARFCPALRRVALALLAAFALQVPSRVALGQSNDIDVQLFLPPAGRGATFTIEDPAVPRHLTGTFGVATSLAIAPLVRDVDDEAVVGVLNQTELLAAVGLFEWMQFGLAFPFVVSDPASDPFAPELEREIAVGVSDPRLSLKVPVLRGAFALSGRIVFTVPLGRGSDFASVGYWTTTPGAVATYTIGRLTLAGEAAYRFRRRSVLGGLEQDDELQLGTGASYGLTPALALVGEAQLRVGTGGRSLRSNEVPMEIDGGARWFAAKGFTLDFGVGTGLLAGYGAPVARVFAIARYATEEESCAAGPEDYDGFQDEDFCAELDNDSDTVLDADDECPNDAEDRDGFLDQDGCPDTDNDADGVVDSRDRCPNESEDRDGYEDSDGCPELDNDSDGMADGIDECPMEPEDRDDFQDEDGCPEPGPNQPSVTVTDTRILISERIYFDYDQDTIRSVSLPLLNEVASAIQAIPRSRRVRVEGYADSQGNARYNLDLSYRRARSVVEYLAARGVPRERLEYSGYGAERPVAPNDTDEGRALNRRVEFTILEPAERGATLRTNTPRQPTRPRRQSNAPSTTTPPSPTP